MTIPGPATGAGGTGVGVSFAQCQNGAPPSTSTACPGGWVNGTLQATNSHYAEDQVVPQRLQATAPDTANHTVRFSYQAIKNGVHAYDSLATWNVTQTSADPCQGIAASICSSTPTTFPMASDGNSLPPVGPGISPVVATHELPATSRQWTAYGGAVTATSAITYNATDALVTITFHANAANVPMLILFGGHLSVSGPASVPRAWGVGLGASNVSGGPYHINVDAVDNSGGGPANNIQAGAVLALSPAFSITKSASTLTPTAGQTVTYTITVTNTGPGPGSVMFTDVYDSRLSPTLPVSNPSGGTCTQNVAAASFTCGTSQLAASGGQQTFTYSAVMPQSFTSGANTGGCTNGTYPIVNTATLSTGGTPATVTVCVTANPKFTITKTADQATVNPGDTVKYTITVTNTGSAPGSTTFTDDYDNRVTPTNITISGTGGSCNPPNGTLVCTTGTLAPLGGQQVFTYQVTVPLTFSGDPGTGCGPNQFAITNTVTLTGQTSLPPVTVCVNASPSFTIQKDVSAATASPGDTVTYTITVTNGGAAAGSTSFIDDYDDRLTPSAVTISGTGGSCSPIVTSTGNKELSCTTGTIAGHSTQTFTYMATLPSLFTGDPGGFGCSASNPQQYAVHNVATLANNAGSDDATVCVNASPSFSVTKDVSPNPATPGATVTYVITVKNTGSASGSTTFTDDFDDRLSPSAVTISGTGGSCQQVTTGTGNKELSCTTGTINGGTSNNTQTFTYTAVVPSTFSGNPGGSGCTDSNPQQYPINNTVVLAGGANITKTLCVNAAPKAQITKSVVKTVLPSGSEQLTYTITYGNTGSADAASTKITDNVPAGTSYVSCSNNCVTTGSPTVTSLTWNLGPTAAGSTGNTVTFVVLVTTTSMCTITNTASLQFDANPAVASNAATVQIDPVANPAGAHASGNAIGAQVVTTGLIGISTSPIGQASSSRSGPGPTSVDHKYVVGISVPANGSLLRLPVLNETSASAVSANPPYAQDVSSASLANICVFPVGNICTVQADTVQAVASTLATGSWATYSSGGSTIQNLKIVGLGTVVDLNQTTKINLNPLVFGPNSYVAINERTGSAGLVGGSYVADEQVTLIHVVITGLLNLQSANIIVSRATSHADFPATLVCGNVAHQSVSGHAFVAQLTTDPTIADTTVGYVSIPPTGANESQQIVGVNLPADDSIIGASAGGSRSFSNLNSTTSYAESSAELGGNIGPQACILKLSATSCLITAQLVHSQSQSTATAAGATSTDAGTSLLSVSVAGVPLGLNVPPNTAIILPGIGYVVLNEQFCDGGGLTYTHSCTGLHHSGLTVRAVDLVVTLLGSGLGVVPGTQLIVAEAHSDATFGA